MNPLTAYVDELGEWSYHNWRRIRILFADDYVPKTRKRVLLKKMRIGGTVMNAGTVVNTVSVRAWFADRQAVQDRNLDRYIGEE